MGPGVRVAAEVPHPDVEASVEQDESECLARPEHHPVRGGGQHAVLQEDDGLAGVGDAVQGEQVAVLRPDGVRLGRVPVAGDEHGRGVVDRDLTQVLGNGDAVGGGEVGPPGLGPVRVGRGRGRAGGQRQDGSQIKHRH